jgi:replicative DNA helicase
MAATPDIEFERGLPASLDAERTILGAILLDNGAYYEAAESLQAEDFALTSHQRVFRRMGELCDSQRAVDIVTLSEELARRKEIASVGGVAWLASLTEGLPRRLSISEYVRIVREKSLARRLIAISSETITRCADQSEVPAEVLSSAIADMEDSLARDGRGGGRTIGDILAEDTPRFEAQASAPSGGTLGASLFTPNLSGITCGIHEGELCLICARPHQGKTEAAIQTIIENARRGLRVHMFSLEMKGWQIVRRMTRLMARVPTVHMRDPRALRPDERKALADARAELRDLPIVIDDTHELTASEFRARCVLATRRWRADLIVVDYAQLLLVPRAKSIIEAAPKQAEALRHIARDYCRILALAQLRRAPPNDLNRYPDIEDILGSSAFEQAAQIILLLHRAREDKKYTGQDFCFLAKMRELQVIDSYRISAERWGAFKDVYAAEQAA